MFWEIVNSGSGSPRHEHIPVTTLGSIQCSEISWFEPCWHRLPNGRIVTQRKRMISDVEAEFAKIGKVDYHLSQDENFKSHWLNPDGMHVFHPGLIREDHPLHNKIMKDFSYNKRVLRFKYKSQKSH